MNNKILPTKSPREVIPAIQPSFLDLIGSIPNIDKPDPVKRIRALRRKWR